MAYFMKMLKLILNLIKKLLLLTLYCMLPNKYEGESFEEWLGEENDK